MAPKIAYARLGVMWCSDGERWVMSHGFRRIVTGHDLVGRSVVLSEHWPDQTHAMSGPAIGANFHEIWREESAVPELSANPPAEPTAAPFQLMPSAGHLIRMLEVYPLSQGGFRTAMHRTRTIDYVVVLSGELVLILDDGERTLKAGDVVIQRGTDHAWENRSETLARAMFIHIDARFSADLRAVLPEKLHLLS
jgi:mannose-6-phosphate isomerase-like protein (cupin superfamily)